MIEAVVALAVVAMGVTAIGSLAATATNGSRTLSQHVALMETARLIITGIPRRADLASDDLSGEVLGHRWQIRALPFVGGGAAVPDSPWLPQRVVIRVQSPSGAVLGLETIRLQKRPPP